jgi:hypothetical protein
MFWCRLHKMSQPQPQTAMFSLRKAKKDPALEAKIAQLKLPLAPLVRLTSGTVHPAFPKTFLNYHLLTSSELDELAHFYHQRTPCRWTAHYPKPMNWREGLTIDEKRRKFGRFMGLRGCESPVKTEEELQEELIREARARVAEEDEILRSKARGYY